MARKELARTFLKLHGNDPRHRNYYIQLGRKYIGIDISADYLKLSLETRLQTGVLNLEALA